VEGRTARSAKVSEGRLLHELELELEERGQPASHGAFEDFQRGGGARFGIEIAMLLPAHLFAPGLSQGAALLRSCGVHRAEDTLAAGRAQGVRPRFFGLAAPEVKLRRMRP